MISGHDIFDFFIFRRIIFGFLNMTTYSTTRCAFEGSYQLENNLYQDMD